MRSLLKMTAVITALLLVFFSCKKDEKKAPTTDEISQQVRDKIYELGFGSKNVAIHPEGYLVEGDIVITENDLNSTPERQLIRVGNEEQYRTTNLVTGLPRNITVRVASNLSSYTSYVTAVDSAIARYNAQSLQVTFSRVTSGGNIVISRVTTSSYLASAGFPSGGNPYNSILVSTTALSGQPLQTLTSVIAHEMGHCIGFRHTDYANRSYSCGGSAVNEGQAGVGAINIPGTPDTYAVSGSWMLSCINSGGNRPFIGSDITALNYLY